MKYCSPKHCVLTPTTSLLNTSVRCAAQAETLSRTGVEMEALNAVQVALLTIYDMCKAIDKEMVIQSVRLLEKTGGASGDYRASG